MTSCFFRGARRTLAALVLLGTLTARAGAQTLAARLDAYFSGLSADRAFNGTVLITDGDRTVYDRSFGMADFARGTARSTSTTQNIASISKTMTAVAVLQLRDAGALSLDDPIAKYLPTFPEPRVTVRQLLSHTSGLVDGEALLDSATRASPAKMFSNADAYDILVHASEARAFSTAPGERWSYSNLGYQVLALLVERVTGASFAAYMRDHVFRPAGMTDSYVFQSGVPSPPRAVGYTYDNHYAMRLALIDTVSDMKRFTVGAGALVGSTNVISSARDLRAFDHALYSEVLLSRATLAEAFTPVRLNNGKTNTAVAGSYGLGWFIESDSARGTTVSHSGAGPGVTTFLVRHLDRKQTVIILMNIQNPGFRMAPVLRMLAGESVPYRHSAAFAYARDVYEKGPDSAAALLEAHRADSAHYELDEGEMNRVGLEFSRVARYQAYSLEAYRLNTVFFPESKRARDAYASALARSRQGQGSAQ